ASYISEQSGDDRNEMAQLPEGITELLRMVYPMKPYHTA
ncbi:hypothetical protein AALP_AAs59911U000100, partial [Arabis alpina]